MTWQTWASLERTQRPLTRKDWCSILVLSRRQGESLRLGKDIVVVVTKIAGNRVFIGIEAPKDVAVSRTEQKPRGRRGEAA
jgi:carbon storage regulator CsrA